MALKIVLAPPLMNRRRLRTVRRCQIGALLIEIDTVAIKAGLGLTIA
jgi:hypothetical protein